MNPLTSIYLACFHSEIHESFDGCSGQYLTVEKAIQAGEWPYDNGDDPSFYVARRGGPLTWGVCRRDLRNAIKDESIVVFFSFTPSPDDSILYRLCAVATVVDKLFHHTFRLDPRLAKFRHLYINTLIHPEGSRWRYSEADRPPSSRHQNWLWRMSKTTGIKSDDFKKKYASTYQGEWFEGNQNGGSALPLARNYVVFSTRPNETFVSAAPPEVAIAVGQQSEKWTDSGFHELTVGMAKTNGGRDNLRIANPSGRYPHRHIRFNMPTEEAVEWRKALIAALRDLRRSGQPQAEDSAGRQSRRRSSC